MAALPYPKNANLGEDLDIIVLREGGAIELANRTALAYQDHYLWLNREYVALIGQIRIGTDNRYELARFIDRHQESYPVGTFLTPDKTRPLVSADLFNPTTGQRHRLVVRTSGGM